MISYEIKKGTGKNGNEYVIISMKFLLKDGSIHEIQKFATREEITIFKFLASQEQLQEYLENPQF